MESLTVNANLDALAILRHYVMEASEMAGLNQKKSYNLRLAVDEIATNIISYGYEQEETPGNITISAEINEKGLKITLEDQGIFFDPRQQLSVEEETVTKPLAERNIGGLGIYLTINGVDEFQYQRVDDRNFNIFIIRP